MLFAGSQLTFNPNTLLVLIGTSFGAGFAPLAVIEKMTQQWKLEKEQWKIEAKINEGDKKETEEKISKLTQQHEQVGQIAQSAAKEYQEQIDKLKQAIRDLSENNE